MYEMLRFCTRKCGYLCQLVNDTSNFYKSNECSFRYYNLLMKAFDSLVKADHRRLKALPLPWFGLNSCRNSRLNFLPCSVRMTSARKCFRRCILKSLHSKSIHSIHFISNCFLWEKMILDMYNIFTYFI